MIIFGLHSTSDDWPLCWSHYRWRVRLQDWLHSGDEFSIAFKVNYISEDLLLVMVTSSFLITLPADLKKNGISKKQKQKDLASYH